MEGQGQERMGDVSRDWKYRGRRGGQRQEWSQSPDTDTGTGGPIGPIPRYPVTKRVVNGAGCCLLLLMCKYRHLTRLISPQTDIFVSISPRLDNDFGWPLAVSHPKAPTNALWMCVQTSTWPPVAIAGNQDPDVH